MCVQWCVGMHILLNIPAPADHVPRLGTLLRSHGAVPDAQDSTGVWRWDRAHLGQGKDKARFHVISASGELIFEAHYPQRAQAVQDGRPHASKRVPASQGDRLQLVHSPRMLLVLQGKGGELVVEDTLPDIVGCLKDMLVCALLAAQYIVPQEIPMIPAGSRVAASGKKPLQESNTGDLRGIKLQTYWR